MADESAQENSDVLQDSDFPSAVDGDSVAVASEGDQPAGVVTPPPDPADLNLGEEAGGPPDGGPPVDEGDEDGFPPELLAMAGLSAEEAASRFQDPYALEAALRWQDEQAAALGKRSLGQQQPPQQQPPRQQFNFPPQQQQPQWQQQWQVPPQQPPVQQPPAQQQPPPQQPRWKPMELKLDEEQWDPDTVKVLTALNEHYGKQFGELEKEFQTSGQRNQLLEQTLLTLVQHQIDQGKTRYFDQFDQQVNGLGEEWKKTFGQGTRQTLNPNSAEFVNRARLEGAVREINAGRQQLGLPGLTLEQSIRRALPLEFSKEYDAQVTRTAVRQTGGRRSQMLSRPTHRRGKSQSPEQRAGNRIEEFMREKGIQLAPEPEGATEF